MKDFRFCGFWAVKSLRERCVHTSEVEKRRDEEAQVFSVDLFLEELR